MDASQYKDYVLVLLFIKYVSDKYAGQPYAPITIPPGASFKDMVALKGTQLGHAAGWHLSADSHYQLCNRFAWAWKVASLGVPAVLVYLGFLGTEEMPKPLTSAEDWRDCVLAHANGVVPTDAWERPVTVGSASIISLIRSARIAVTEERAPSVEVGEPDKPRREIQQGVSAILCADWGKEPGKRAVYLADVSRRKVSRVASSNWSVAAVLREAKKWESRGPVLATFDAPLGVPESYLAAVASLPNWGPARNFIEFLTTACSKPGFFDATSAADQWSVGQPFFAVPAGPGGLGSYVRAAAEQKVNLYRSIDTKTRAKTVFAKSGIPGSVGSAACALWTELGAQLTAGRAFSVWPFEGDLDALLKSAPVVIGEIYPRAAYATALLDESEPGRPPLALAKTDPDIRRSAITALQNAPWVRRQNVTLEDLADAQKNEDDFDACMTAAALLRCVLEDLPLSPLRLDSTHVEGGILGTGSVNLLIAEKTWNDAPGQSKAGSLPTGSQVITPANESNVAPERDNPRADPGIVRGGTRIYRCPIAGCDKVYLDSRGGWDAHVGSVRLHQGWHPEIISAEQRRRQFEIEFPDFFR